VGWLLVVRVVSRLYPCVRVQSQWRALGRLAAYGWALQERYRIELVFGRVQGGVWELHRLSACGVWDGSGVGFVGVVEGGAVFACWGWCIFLLCVGCGGSVMVVWWVEEEFSNTLRQHLTFLTYLEYHGE
jgi:hypothetical protein